MKSIAVIRVGFLACAMGVAGLAHAATGASPLDQSSGLACPAGSVADPTQSTVCISEESAYVTSGQYARDLAATAAQQATENSNPQVSMGNGLTGGGAEAVSSPGYQVPGSANRYQPSGPQVGTIGVPYTTTDGQSGSCVYSASQVGGINAGTGFNLAGNCTSPSGTVFQSSGTAASVPGEPGVYKIQAGFGSANQAAGPFGQAVLTAMVDTSNGTVTDAQVTADNQAYTPMGFATDSYASQGSALGATTVVNPYSTVNATAMVPITLSDGSSCDVYSTPWVASSNGQQTLVGQCTSSNGKSFTLTGSSGINYSGSQAFSLYGSGPDGQVYSVGGDYNGQSGAVSSQWGTDGSSGQQVQNSLQGIADPNAVTFHAGAAQAYSSGVATMPQAASAFGGGGGGAASAPAYRLSFGGSSNGSCSLGAPGADGSVSGTCVTSGGQTVAVSGTATQQGNGLYGVHLNSNNGAVAANVSYDVNTGSGYGTWGGAGSGAASNGGVVSAWGSQ